MARRTRREDGGIATRWERSPDAKGWTFYLRKGVKFHNGDDLTSEGVKFVHGKRRDGRTTTSLSLGEGEGVG